MLAIYCANQICVCHSATCSTGSRMRSHQNQ